MAKDSWDNHYKNKYSVLSYPDENLVRMLKKHLAGKDSGEIENLNVVDLGCGSGRHIKMMFESGLKYITGLDYSMNGLEICKDLYSARLLQAENESLPFKDNSFDIAVSWGSLHYSDKDSLKVQLNEIHRILNKNACFLGTLRSDRDTYLRKGKDIGNNTWVTDLSDLQNSVVSFYNEDELKSALSIFRYFEYGIMERSILGDMTKTVSHWYFRAYR
ncbi:MAG: class I SAM-dependent methyltransferase [Spirochaetes bacterium]|nr:class I SAM-dependent methyltransferase [Spirochaetota bacterium]